MTVRLRPYAMPDRASLIQVIDTVCGEGRWMSTAQYDPTPAWEHALQQPGCGCHLLLLAVNKDSVVGWCRIFPKTGSLPQAASLGIGLLASYRGQGIGTRLVQRALTWAWSAGLRRVTLLTRLDNHRALRVFSHCGFHFTAQARDEWIEMACDQPTWRSGHFGAPEFLRNIRQAPVVGQADQERVWL